MIQPIIWAVIGSFCYKEHSPYLASSDKWDFPGDTRGSILCRYVGVQPGLAYSICGPHGLSSFVLSVNLLHHYLQIVICIFRPTPSTHALWPVQWPPSRVYTDFSYPLSRANQVHLCGLDSISGEDLIGPPWSVIHSQPNKQ